MYPDASGPDGEKLTTIAWIWARTVESPDPSWPGHVPLVASWTLAKRPGRPTVWIEPIIDRYAMTISYEIHEGGQPAYDRTVERGNGRCVATGAAISGDYIKSESRAGRMGQQMMAVVAEGERGRIYAPATADDKAAANCKEPDWKPEGRNPEKLTGGTVFVYGLDEWWKLFTPRQLTALTTFSDLLVAVVDRAKADASAAGLAVDGVRLRDGGRGADAYADAVVTYLAFVIDKCTNLWSNIVTWMNDRGALREVFAAPGNPYGVGLCRSWSFLRTSGQLGTLSFQGTEGRFATPLKRRLSRSTTCGSSARCPSACSRMRRRSDRD